MSNFIRPHRPPELLFSPTSYSAIAVDLWSLGTTIAQFFTPLRLIPSQSRSASPYLTASEEADQLVPGPFLISPSLRNKIDYRATWERTTLFKGEQGELGLAWSIFRLRGTPNHENWPVGLCRCHHSRVLVTFCFIVVQLSSGRFKGRVSSSQPQTSAHNAPTFALTLAHRFIRRLFASARR